MHFHSPETGASRPGRRSFMKYPLLLIPLLWIAAASHAEVRVLVERNVRDMENPDFKFKTIPPISDTDAGQDATIEVVDGKPDWGCDPRQLIDGIGPGKADEMSRSFFFGKNTNGGRIHMDLAAIKPIAAVNTYSWNNGSRAPQVYTLYGSDGTGPTFLPSPVLGTDPAAVGWKKIATVDTRPPDFMKKDGGGGQYAVHIAQEQGPIGRYRYLLWDIKPTLDQPWASTVYAEFDVLVEDAPPPSRLAILQTIDGKKLEGTAHVEADTLVLHTGDADQRIKLTDIKSATFREAITTEAAVEEPSAGGLKAEYFDDQELQKPRLVRYDPTINFQWGLGAPDPSINVDFSARWTGRIEPKYSEVYYFQTHAEDGVRLWIDGKPIIDKWVDSPPYLQEGKIALQAGKRYDLKVEYHNRMGEALMRLRWASASQPKQVIPASRLSPPLDDPASPPRIMLTSPVADRWRIAPGSMELEATAAATKGEIARVEFFSGNTLLGTVTTAPYHYTWVHVPPGHHKLTARATDEAGTITASPPVMVNVAANGAGSLPPPWGSMRLGAMERRDSSSYSGGLFTVRAGGGELSGAFDSGYFIAQPLDGDGQITVRVGDVTTNATPNAVAGLMIRETLSGDARYAALVAGKENSRFLCRREPGSWVAANDLNRAVPCYLRLVRTGIYIKAYISDNGSSWQLVGSDQLTIGSQSFVGLIATSGADDDLSTATLDHVEVHAGAPPMDATTSGIRTRAGSFLAGEIKKADDMQVILERPRGRTLAVPVSDIARVYLRAAPVELAASIGHERSGVLLATGDFYEGDFRGIVDGRIKVDSVVFGMKSFENPEVLAVVLHDISETPHLGTVTTSDGSVYLPKTLKLEAGRFALQDEVAGDLSISVRDVTKFQR
jgi:hypothetical protein